MAGRARSTKSGNALRDRVVKLAHDLKLQVKTEVRAARRLWGSKRHIDVVIMDEKSGRSLGIECKFQDMPGTAEEKIPATIQDIGYWPISGIVVIDGEGFSNNMRSYLMSTGKVILFDELKDWLCLYFGLKDE